MTLEQVKALTDEELRIKVAELLGWVKVPHRSRPLTGKEFSIDSQGIAWTSIDPEMLDYPKDLNACHEMEETLIDEQKRFLYEVTLHSLNVSHELGISVWETVHASARQRCEAFVLTMCE
jgi:hypothetical protein